MTQGNTTGPVKRLLATLDRTDRYIVLMHYADGLTAKEVALVLDLPVRVVESALARLRNKLLAAVNAAQTASSMTRYSAVA